MQHISSLYVLPTRFQQRLFEDQKVQEYLDAGRGHCWLKHSEVAELVQEAVKHHDGESYVTHVNLIDWFATLWKIQLKQISVRIGMNGDGQSAAKTSSRHSPITFDKHARSPLA